MSKIVKGDHVVVISGRDKGKQGQGTRVVGDIVLKGIKSLTLCVMLKGV